MGLELCRKRKAVDDHPCKTAVKPEDAQVRPQLAPMKSRRMDTSDISLNTNPIEKCYLEYETFYILQHS